jgi:hypothetical protein
MEHAARMARLGRVVKSEGFTRQVLLRCSSRTKPVPTKPLAQAHPEQTLC